MNKGLKYADDSSLCGRSNLAILYGDATENNVFICLFVYYVCTHMAIKAGGQHERLPQWLSTLFLETISH